MTKYTLETKLEVVQDYLKGKDSYKGVARKHQVTESMVAKWVKRFRQYGLEGLQKKYRGTATCPSS
ncbi:helix-turn-helix domain-containing protein [Ectobacillus antri]|uniref:helix-turn-helix domain-containing protein n=1 Tax=Ectobacillus antri TaxID=2486280 RepID=UPI000F58F95B|nr:helix-turn-helix domain-containing protein [Ectobacillus antri]